MIQKRKDNYQPLAIGNTKMVSQEEWATHWRPHGPGWKNPVETNPCYSKRFYGGSDMSVILGCSPWKTKLQLFHEKTGIEPKFKTNINEDSKELGHIYETAIALKYHYYKRKEGTKNLTMFVEGYIVNPDGSWRLDKDGNRAKNLSSVYMYRDGRKKPDGSFLYPWASANVDGLIMEGSEQGLLEIKTTSPRNYETIEKWKAGIVPEYYFWQCVYYMFVLNIQFCDICCSWGQTMDDMAVIRIYRDYEVEDKLIKAIEEFEEYVEQNVEPDVSSENAINLVNYYYQLYGKTEESAEYIELPGKFKNSIVNAMELEKEEKILKEKLKEIELKKAQVHAELYPIFKNHSYGQLRLDNENVAGVTLKTPMKRRKMDVERFAQDNPELYKQFQIFDCAGFGQSSADNKRLKEKYMLPAEPNFDISSTTKPSYSIKLLKRPLKN